MKWKLKGMRRGEGKEASEEKKAFMEMKLKRNYDFSRQITFL